MALYKRIIIISRLLLLLLLRKNDGCGCVLRSYVWRIPVTWLTSQGHTGSVWLNDKEATFELPQLLNATALDWIKLNINESAYYRVNYIQSNWHALAAAVQRQHTVGL